ncbi:MAG: HEAT repeat domain-containing protein [Armatimonadetes bacterium]|nr:HEAT repeat domain-containing protein [Armatimonadota bacterium]
MRKGAFWAVVAVLVGAAMLVRLLSRPSEDAHERMHAEEVKAQAAVESLASLPVAQRLQKLKEYLSLESPIAMRAEAVEALARIDTAEARAMLREALRDFASPVRVRVAETASSQPRDYALELLVDCLADHDTEVRQSALLALQQIRDRRAVNALITLLREDSNEKTQHMAMGVLRALTGQPFYARYTDPPARRQQARQQWLAWLAKAQAEFPAITPRPVHPSQTQPAPDLTLRTLEGARISLRRPEKPLLLHFWGTWCGACQQELPHLTAFHRKYGNQVQVVGVAFDEPAGARGLQQFCAARGVRYPQVLGDAPIREAFDIHGVPQSVLIDTQGRIRFWWVGARDTATFERAVQRLLK